MLPWDNLLPWIICRLVVYYPDRLWTSGKYLDSIYSVLVVVVVVVAVAVVVVVVESRSDIMSSRILRSTQVDFGLVISKMTALTHTYSRTYAHARTPCVARRPTHTYTHVCPLLIWFLYYVM